jgi:predicted phosphoribosyltransferase
MQLPFENRAEAGRLLSERLTASPKNALVVALARGGVPVGYEVAKRLRAPLEVMAARKLGVPWRPELAMGALAGTVCVLDREIIRGLGISDEEVEHVINKEKSEMKRREDLYRGGRPALELKGRRVILVDDGLATGNTMRAAVRYARQAEAGEIIAAVPVGSEEACEILRLEADAVECLAVPQPFCAVGEWYREFRPVEDAEVQSLLAKSRDWVREKTLEPAA